MRSGIIIFILASILIHAAIISIQNEWVFSINEYHEQGSSILDIEILSQNNSTPGTNSNPIKKTNTTEKPQSQPIIKKQIISSITPPSPSKNTRSDGKNNVLEKNNLKKIMLTEKSPLDLTTTHLSMLKKISPENLKKKTTNITGNTPKNNNNEKLKTLLNNELAKYFYYPKAAQRKNHQGKVILAFTINSDGLIKNIHIEKSSGYRILDNAAIKALKKVDANRDFVLELNNHSAELTVPINYQLFNH